MTGHDAVPPLVAAAASRAREAGFPMSCDPAVGRLLAVLAAHLPARAKVVELGTGAGAGTAWAYPDDHPQPGGPARERNDEAAVSCYRRRLTQKLMMGAAWVSRPGVA